MSVRVASSVRIGSVWATHPDRQRGLSLVELMIGLVVGLILVAAVFNIYAGNVRSARFTEGVQAIQENGRYAISVLQRGFRLAGYSPSADTADELVAFDIANSGASTLTLRSRQSFDCNGLSTADTDGVAVNTYTLNTDTNELTCRGNQQESSDMAIVEGVDQFRLLYGVDDDGNEGTCEPQQYIPYNESIKSSEVVALRFAVLVNSGSPIRTRSVSNSYVLLDQEIQGESDRLVREVFSGTVLLRNNISCTGI